MKRTDPFREKQSLKILLVDDDAPLLRIRTRILDHAGIEVETADNGEDAISKLQSGHFDIVITDLIMPRVNGFQVALEALRQKVGQIVINSDHGQFQPMLEGLIEQKSTEDELNNIPTEERLDLNRIKVMPKSELTTPSQLVPFFRNLMTEIMNIKTDKQNTAS